MEQTPVEFLSRHLRGAIDFVISRAWIDLVSVGSTLILPAEVPEGFWEKVVYVVTASLVLFMARDLLIEVGGGTKKILSAPDKASSNEHRR